MMEMFITSRDLTALSNKRDFLAEGEMDRRDFLRKGLLVSAGVLAGQEISETVLAGSQGKAQPTNAGASNAALLPKRQYGKTQEQLSLIGFGGMLVMKSAPEDAARLVAQAVERGVNYFDVAPEYGDAEVKLGPALEPYRQNVFLACKTLERTRERAEAELKRSLERLRTDHLDLYQLHALTDVRKDVDTAFSAGGVMELFLAAKKDGRVRHLGFSAHSEEAALIAMDRYDFDSVLFPVNFACFYKGGFGPQIMGKAEAKGVARLALKSMARQVWPKDAPDRGNYSKCWYQPLTDRREAELALRFTLGQPVTAAIPPGEPVLFTLALDVAANLRPLTAPEERELRALADTLTPIFKTT
jgi:aryl-alcohol dehydrogenase-like predicted oxidoreductase